MDKKDIRVMVVDDEPAIVMSLDFLIRKAGFQLFIARNGAEAMQTFAAERPHIVVLDVMMPDMDGFEVCRRIRQEEGGGEAKILFLSAKSGAADKQTGYGAGADDYITKPFSTKFLMERIQYFANQI
jgi:DNA-binding response OmpR family regulator